MAKKQSVETQIKTAIAWKVAEFVTSYEADDFEDALREKAALLIPFLVQKELDKAVRAHITSLVRKEIGGILK